METGFNKRGLREGVGGGGGSEVSQDKIWSNYMDLWEPAGIS